MTKKFSALADIQRRIGDRKIDLIIAGSSASSREVVIQARATVESAMRECGSHVDRMERAASRLSSVFPLTGESLKKLDEESVTRLDHPCR